MVAGVVIGAVGLDGLRYVRRPAERWLASLPVILAAHQLTEAVVWLGLRDRVGEDVWRPALAGATHGTGRREPRRQRRRRQRAAVEEDVMKEDAVQQQEQQQRWHRSPPPAPLPHETPPQWNVMRRT